MARYGTWRPLASDWALQRLMRAHDIICVHTMVGSLWGTDVYFYSGGYGGTESHFGVGHDGEVVQWQDTDHQADANLDGNWHVLSIETADRGPGFPDWDTSGDDVPAWTEAQIARLADLVAFLCREHDIPCELIPDTKPGRRGIGYHRQGVPGYVVPGGELWSSSRGKVCPGRRRIAQVPEVIRRARLLLDGSPLLAPRPEEDPVNIPLHFFDDDWRLAPAGLNFRGTCPAEWGANSALIELAFVRWAAYWGDCSWRVVAHGNNTFDPIGEADPAKDHWQLPPGTRGFTVEGRREHAGVIPAASLITKSK